MFEKRKIEKNAHLFELKFKRKKYFSRKVQNYLSTINICLSTINMNGKRNQRHDHFNKKHVHSLRKQFQLLEDLDANKTIDLNSFI